MALFIGAVARRTGVSAPAIRYYEAIGVLTPSTRSAGGYRCYSRETIEELRFIRKAQTLGFSLEEIGEILRLSRAGKAPCSRVVSIAHQHLAAVDDRIRHLEAFRARLAAAVSRWAGTGSPTCRGLCEIIVEAEDGDGGGDRDASELRACLPAEAGRTVPGSPRRPEAPLPTRHSRRAARRPS